MLHQIPEQLDAIDHTLESYVDRNLEVIDPVERVILRLGTYELINRLETPYKVILNESINLAKAFGSEGSHKYINGILDKVAQRVMSVEIRAKLSKNKPETSE